MQRVVNSKIVNSYELNIFILSFSKKKKNYSITRKLSRRHIITKVYNINISLSIFLHLFYFIFLFHSNCES